MCDYLGHVTSCVGLHNSICPGILSGIISEEDVIELRESNVQGNNNQSQFEEFYVGGCDIIEDDRTGSHEKCHTNVS